MTGVVEAVCVGTRKGERKTPVPEATLVADHGLAGDAHAGPGHRQVSLLDAARADEARRALPDLSAGGFAENVLLRGLDLAPLGLGTTLRLGAAVVSVTQRGKECRAPCAIGRATGDCALPREGLFARVLTGGRVAPGDAAVVMETVARDTLQAVVVTVSDRCSRGEAPDTAGPAVAALLSEALGARIYRSLVLPDEVDRIVERLRHYSGGHGIDLVVTVGGTGFSPRDVTPEAVRAVVERLTPGLDEEMRRASRAETPLAALSRAASGIRGRTLILSLPGSERAARANLAAVLPLLPHGLRKLRGDPADCGREATR